MEETESNLYFNRIVKTSAFVFVAVMLSKVLGYAYKIVIARYFGNEVYGLFSLSMIVIGIAVSIAGVGLFEGLVRQISIYRGQKDKNSIISLVYTSKNFLIISGFVLFGIAFLSAPMISVKVFHEPRLIIFIQVMALAIPFILLANLFLSVLRSYEQIRAQSILNNIIQNSVKFFILLFFIFLGLQIASVPLSYLFAYVILALSAWFYGKKILAGRFSRVNNRDGRKMLLGVMKYSWPLMFIGVLTSIFYWTDSIIIGYFIDVGNVGIYNVAITLVAFLGIVPELFIQLLFPVAALNLSQNKIKLVNLLIRRVAKWIVIINSLIALASFFFAPQLVLWLFKNEVFMPAVTILRILSIGALFTTLAGYFINLLIVAAKTKQILASLVFVAIINLSLDLIMVPAFGLNGAAVATSISGFLLFLITLHQVGRVYSFAPLDHKSTKTIIITLLTFLVGAVILFLSFSVLMSFIAGIILIILYLFIVIYMRLFDKEDVNLFKKIIWKVIFYTGITGFRSKT